MAAARLARMAAQPWEDGTEEGETWKSLVSLKKSYKIEHHKAQSNEADTSTYASAVQPTCSETAHRRERSFFSTLKHLSRCCWLAGASQETGKGPRTPWQRFAAYCD